MKTFIKSNKAFFTFTVIALIVGAVGVITSPGNELIYMVLGQYIILPLTGLICSVFSVKKGGTLGFCSPLVFTLIATLLPIPVLKGTDVAFFIFEAVPCAIGFVFGAVAYVISKARTADKREEKQEAKKEKALDKQQAKKEDEEFSVEAEDVNTSQSNAPEEAEEDEPSVEVAE